MDIPKEKCYVPMHNPKERLGRAMGAKQSGFYSITKRGPKQLEPESKS